jgi:hypothetical protein
MTSPRRASVPLDCADVLGSGALCPPERPGAPAADVEGREALTGQQGGTDNGCGAP